MELIKTVHRIRCEMGVCKNFASYSVKMNRVGIKSSIHICESCMEELYGHIGKVLYRRDPIETTQRPNKSKPTAAEKTTAVEKPTAAERQSC